MSENVKLKNIINGKSYVWLITGAAGFIGSNLLETLLLLDQEVIGLDNFSTGHKKNLDDVKKLVGSEKWNKFKLVEGDIRNYEICRKAFENVDFVLHQAALGSVPRSIMDPISSNNSNVNGFLNILEAAKSSNVKGFVYASSSSVYGDHPALPKKENVTGNQLSPYAVTKYVNELYAHVYSLNYNFFTVGLRYFNVFGPRQDPDGAYAAVIPKWFSSIARNELIYINGDGSTSRDFCYIKNVVQANILAAIKCHFLTKSAVYNVACNERTDLNQLFLLLKNIALKNNYIYDLEPKFQDFRPGDIQHSLANIDSIKKDLGYSPDYNLEKGLIESISYYLASE